VQSFDSINHEALLDKINDPELRPILKKWLKAGIMDHGVFKETEQGTPQGGVISPLLANIALHGLEEDTKEALLGACPRISVISSLNPGLACQLRAQMGHDL
jgi:retron-type reverse transcriptase